MKKSLLRYNLLWVLLFSIVFLPALLVRMKHAPYHRHNPILTALDVDLVGVTAPQSKPPFDLAHIRSHEVQKYLEDKWTTNLPMRNWLVRLNNQIFYSFLKKSYNLDGQLVVGKSNQLFELAYIKYRCDYQQILAKKKAELPIWADKVKQISDYFTQNGKTFVYVMTPSKAEYMPEAIPERFHCKAPGTYLMIREMEKRLTERHVRVVNTADLMPQAALAYHTPMFPEGGTHWNYLGASIGANAIIRTINQHNVIALQPLHFQYQMTNAPEGTDTDLFSLLNLLKPTLTYTVPKVHYLLAATPNKPLTATVIGGSFCGQLIDTFLKTQTFAKVDFYRYFKLEHTSFINATEPPKVLPIHLDEVASLDAILKSDVVILEENAAIIDSNHGELLFDTLNKLVFTKKIGAKTGLIKSH
jgi:alginate O-acetyltransferase complex protein AlgJ